MAENSSEEDRSDRDRRPHGDRPRLLLHGRAFPGVPGVLRAARGEFHAPPPASRRTRSTASRRCWRTRCATRQPTHLAVAFDVSRKTWRSEEFPEYKANRSKTPDEFRGQVELIGELLDAMGVKRFAVEGFEADDVIATLATQAEARGFEVLIVTGDRDSFQLVTGPRHGAVSDEGRLGADPVHPGEGRGEVRAHAAAVSGLRGAARRPVGQPAGDPGGRREDRRQVDQAVRVVRGAGGAGRARSRARSGENLREHLEAVKLNRRLTELVRDVKLPYGPEALARAPYDRPALTVVLDALEFRHAELPGAAVRRRPGRGGGGGTGRRGRRGRREGAGRGRAGRLAGRARQLAPRRGHRRRLGAGQWQCQRDRAGRRGRACGLVRPGAARTRRTSRRSRPGSPTLPGPRCCTTPRARCGSSPSTAGAWPASRMDTALAAYLIKPGRRSFALDALSAEYLGRELAPAGGGRPGSWPSAPTRRPRRTR